MREHNHCRRSDTRLAGNGFRQCHSAAKHVPRGAGNGASGFPLSWRPYVENRGNKAYACLQPIATKTFTLASGRGPLSLPSSANEVIGAFHGTPIPWVGSEIPR